MANPFWPSVDTIEESKKACKSAAGISFFVAIVTAAVVMVQTSGKIKIIEGFNQWAYLDAGLFFIIGLGLCWCSRIAALSGLLLYVAERVIMIQQTGMRASQMILPVIITLIFVAGVRGAFAYHVFRKQEKLEEAQQPILTPVEGQVSEETPKKSKKGLVIFGISLLVIAAVMVAAGVFFSQRNVSSGGPSVSRVSPSVVSSGETAVSGDGKVFHLKTGETVKGKVIREDETYYTVETFGGAQQYVIKEDIARQE